MAVKAGYKKTEVGVIPEEWEPATIGEVATFAGGSQPPRSTFRFSPAKGYVRLIQIRDYKTDEYASFIPETMARKRCTKYDIMIGRYGPPIFQILRGIEGAYNVALIKATPSHRVDHEFFFYILCQQKLFERIDSLSRRSSGQTGIEMPALRTYGLALPPLAEQRIIATALSDVDALLEALERLIAKKRDLKQAAIQQLLTGQTRLSGFSGSWIPTTLGEVATFLSGGTPSRSNDAYWKGDIPWISATSLRCSEIWRSDSNVTEEAVAAGSKFAPVGSTLLLVRGSALHKEILCGLVTKQVCFNQDVKALVPQAKVFPKFLTTLIKGMADDFLKLVSSAGNTAGVLDTKLLKAFEFLLPSLSEQTAIAAVLSDMDAELDALDQRLAKTRDLKQGMMQELLTGRTRLL